MRSLVLLGLTPLTACAMGGAMHQMSFGGKDRAPMAPLAIGTRFYPEVGATIDGTTTPTVKIESADPAVLAVEDGALVAKAAGSSAILVSTDDGSVVDFMQVWVAPATKLTLARKDGELVAGTIGLTVGEDVTLVPALWNGPQRLAGDGGATWTAEGGIAILQDGSANRRRLRATAPGKSTITVAIGDAKTSIEVEVIQ